jgi:hypothetical protein
VIDAGTYDDHGHLINIAPKVICSRFSQCILGDDFDL